MKIFFLLLYAKGLINILGFSAINIQFHIHLLTLLINITLGMDY